MSYTFEVPLSMYMRANQGRLPRKNTIIESARGRSRIINNPSLKKVLTQDREGDDVYMDGIAGEYDGKPVEILMMDAFVIMPYESLKECNC